MKRRLLTSCALAVPALLALPGAAWAQTYPAKPITVIVPFAPGGGSDNIARLITATLSERTGKAFIIGAIAIGRTPAQMGDFMKAQSSRWSKVIKDASIKLD